MKPRYLLYAFRAFCRKGYRLALRKPLLVAPEEQRQRLEKCKACPHYRPFYMADAKCNICGCILSLKTMFVDEVCPYKERPRW